MRSFTAAVAVMALGLAALGAGLLAPTVKAQDAAHPSFNIEEASISDIQSAIVAGSLTSTQVVIHYLKRIEAYNGPCVEEPDGPLGRIVPVRNAGQLNALGTLNLRPATRKAWGFDDRYARTHTDEADTNPALPDALEVAAAQDREFARTGKLVGPLHGVVIAVKDQFDTKDMRNTNGAIVAYANDRPPQDATVVARLREAGAIIIAKSNRGGYQSRSAIGGTVCNAYDTERTPRGSSAGSAVAVTANLVTCAIGEETGTSIRSPAGASSIVGLAPTQELISRAGMSGPGISVRYGPMCRTVEDTARVMSVLTGYDSKDPLTAFSVGRGPDRPYQDSLTGQDLRGVRIGVVREFMDPKLYGVRDEEIIGIIDTAVADLHKTGATIIDPGPGGALFDDCFRRYVPLSFGHLFTQQHPDLFPTDAQGRPVGNHIDTLIHLTLNPQDVPDTISIRAIGEVPATGDSAFWRGLYLKTRGDAAIRTEADLRASTQPITDPQFWASGVNISTQRPYGSVTGPSSVPAATEVNMADRIYQRYAFQQVVLACFADLGLDAVIYPTMNIPPLKLQAPEEPELNGRNQAHWTIFGRQGFPTLTVPAGFTQTVYDREPDPASADGTGTRLVGPVEARLPVGVDFATRPFAEPLLLRIAGAYEAVAPHRQPPADFRGLKQKK